MKPDPSLSNSAARSQESQEPADPSKVLAWLATQATPDHGDAPPMPADLLQDLERKFGSVKEVKSTAAASQSSRLGNLVSSLVGRLALSGGLVAACFVLFLVLRGGNDGQVSQNGTTTIIEPVLRGGNDPAKQSVDGIAWKWIGADSFGTELARLKTEGFTEELANARNVVTLDAQSDPQFVLVSGAKSGETQGNWSLRLPKLPADAQRPDRWLQLLIQLQEKIDSSAP